MINQSRFKNRLKDHLFGGALRQPCCFCERPMYFLHATLEHITPMAHGGTWDIANLALSCFPCNNERGTMDFETYKKQRQERRLRA